MKEITLNVYEENMKNVKKTCIAIPVKIPFRIIRRLMKLFEVEKIEDVEQILLIVSDSWEEVTDLLTNIFPEMNEDDWDTVDIKELVQVVYKLIKYALKELLSIPTEKN